MLLNEVKEAEKLNQSQNANWFKMLAIGFSIVSFFLSIAIIGYIITQFLKH